MLRVRGNKIRLCYNDLNDVKSENHNKNILKSVVEEIVRKFGQCLTENCFFFVINGFREELLFMNIR
jgi:hypothetical protein